MPNPHLEDTHPLRPVQERQPQPAHAVGLGRQRPHRLEDPAGQRAVDGQRVPGPRTRRQQRPQPALLVVGDVDGHLHAHGGAGLRDERRQPVGGSKVGRLHQAQQCGERPTEPAAAHRGVVGHPALAEQLVEPLVERVGEHVDLRGRKGHQAQEVALHLQDVRVAADGEVPRPQLVDGEVGDLEGGSQRTAPPLLGGVLVPARSGAGGHRRRRTADSTTARATSASGPPSSPERDTSMPKATSSGTPCCAITTPLAVLTRSRVRTA